jgi:hypothetical protein
MSVGRYARHTLNLLSKPAALQTVRDVVVYAPDMLENPVMPPFEQATQYNDPYWNFHSDADAGVSVMVKLPEDRVRGTPVKFYLEFSIPTGPGGGTIMWRLDYLVRGVGNMYNVTPAQRFLPTVSNASYRITRTAKLEIPAWEVDYQHALGQPVEFFIGIIRQGTHPDDTEASEAHLHKLVMEYTSHY